MMIRCSRSLGKSSTIKPALPSINLSYTVEYFFRSPFSGDHLTIVIPVGSSDNRMNVKGPRLSNTQPYPTFMVKITYDHRTVDMKVENIIRSIISHPQKAGPVGLLFDIFHPCV